MSATVQFLALLALDLAGLALLWFLLRARVRRYLELENLLSGVREEARALVMELNETADRNVSLVEDKIIELRGLLGEVDRRYGLAKRELESRESEREVFERLRRRRPIVPESADPIPLELRSSEPSEEHIAAVPASSRKLPEVVVSPEPVGSARSRREDALDLYRKGFSADIIAVRLGATVSEIELLVDMEERRSEARASSSDLGAGS